MRVGVIVWLAACKPPVEAPVDDLAWDAAREALVLRRDGDERLVIPRAGLQLGVLDAYDDQLSYDPFWDTPQATWLEPTRVEEVAGDGLTLRLTYDGASATLSLREDGDGRFGGAWTPDAGTVGWLRIDAEVDPAERFYGLGSVLDHPEHRGRRRAMQTELEPTSESLYNEAHVPIPLLIGTRGWGLFVEDRHPMVWDVATERDDRVTMTVGLGEAAAGGLQLHLYTADHPLDVTARYLADAGAPRVPGAWALGPLVWRDENVDQAQFEADLAAMRDLDLACSGVWVDRPYASGIQTFDFEAARFPDPERMIGLAHDLGFRVALWHVPYLSPEESPDLYAEAEANGWFPPESPPIFNPWGPLIDFTQPDAMAWWTSLVRRYTDLGVEGFKLDYAEDVVVGLNGGRLAWRFADGSDERTMHDVYPMLYHQAYRDALTDDSLLLNRTGTYGDQTLTSVIWPGDLDADLLAWGETAVDRDGSAYQAVGGLEASLVDALSLGPSGYPFYGSDTGGYRHSPPDNETFMRWFEQTALSTVMQIGTSSNDVAWEPTPQNGFDAATLDTYRVYTRLHLRLFPYLWTDAQRLADGGRPLMRPLGLAYPELDEEPGDTYLLGDALLVAPVVRRGDRTRDVLFPPGAWIDWFDGSAHAPDGREVVDAPLDKLPLYLAAGAIVPLLRPTIDTLAPVVDPGAVDSFATDPGVLWARAAPGPAYATTLFDGTRLEAADGALTWTPGTTFTQGGMVEVMLPARPAAVELDGAPVPEVADPADGGWAWRDEAGGLAVVRVPPAGGRLVVR
ncbi:MAG TPA: glycoside hydrolase family 31 protein [Myxococcota bacterium]|nr:glycoside hydrolase family 31 protein [Myxococcota bacterium]